MSHSKLGEFEIDWGLFTCAPGNPWVRVEREIWVVSDRLSLCVPMGMWCDGASVPNGLWSMLTLTPLMMLLYGTVHDFMYRKDCLITLDDEPVTPTRVQADVIFRGLVASTGESYLGDARRCYYAVRVAGGSSYHQRDTRFGWVGSVWGE